MKVSYSNQAELRAQNAIITEQEAENLTKEDALDYLQAQGRPFFTDSLTEEAIAEIQNHWGQQLLASILFHSKQEQQINHL